MASCWTISLQELQSESQSGMDSLCLLSDDRKEDAMNKEEKETKT